MERHEYRDINFWKTLEKTDYAIISSINQDAMSKLVNMMRGKRTVERYAYECGIGTSTVYKICNKERKSPLQYEQLLNLYEYREVDCGVGFEHLLAANGMILLHDVLKLQKKILKKKGVYTESISTKKITKKEKKQKKACEELKKLIDEMRGNRDYAAYAVECGMTKGMIIYIVSKQRKTALSETQLKALYNHIIPGCTVSMEKLRKANNSFPNAGKLKQGIETSLEADSSQSTVKEHLNRTSQITYEDYLEDLAFYLLKKPTDIVADIRNRCKKIYEDKITVNLLHDFRTSSETEWDARVGAVRNFFESKSLLTLPTVESEDFKKQLDSILIK